MTPFIVGLVLALIVTAVQKFLIKASDRPSQFGNSNVGVFLFTEAALILVGLVLFVAMCAVGTKGGLMFLGGWLLIRAYGVLTALLSIGR